MDSYYGSQQWHEDVEKAARNWKVVDEFRTLELTMVEAEAKTGSRYVVFVARLRHRARGMVGGPMLVSVLWPWQDCWGMSDDGVLASSYVAEHLCGGRFLAGQLHGGDLAALTLTVAHALDRQAMLPQAPVEAI